MKRILFISHEASRTGAPLVLLGLMKQLKNNYNNLRLDCLCLSNGGDLVEEFKAVSHNFYNYNLPKSPSIVEKIFCKLKGETPKKKYRNKVKNLLLHQEYSIIYSNSVMSLDVGVELKKKLPKCKLLLHLHELNVNVKLYAPNFTAQVEHVDQFICVSNIVKANLTDNYGVEEEKLQVVYPFSMLNVSHQKPVKEVDGNTFVVGASGSVNYRKGYDLFLCVAKEVATRMPSEKIVFRWVGKFSNHRIEAELLADIKKSGLQDTVQFMGELDNPISEYNNFDIFLMTSREDPFPLVCIEAGALAKPIICFEGATGTEEVLKIGGGEITPYLSISAMADKIINYFENREKLLNDGIAASKLFREYSIEKQLPKLIGVLATNFEN